MLIRHSILYALSKLLPGILGMATTAALTHILNPSLYGVYGLALVIMNFGSNIAFDWLGLSFLRFYQSRRDDPRMVSTFVQMFFIIAALTFICCLIAWFSHLIPSADVPVYAIGVVLMCSYSWFELVSRFEIANFRPTRYLLMNLGRASFTFVCACTAAWLTRNPILTAAGTAGGTLLGAVFGGFRGWSLKAGSFDRALARAVLLFGLPIAASMILSGLVNSGTRGLLAALDSTEALGRYTAAYLLVQNTLAIGVSGIVSAGYSLAVRAVETGDSEVARRQLLANSTLLLAVLAPAACGMALTAQGIAGTLVGPQYVDAVAQLTPWMAAGSFFWVIRGSYLDQSFQLGRRPNLQVQITGLAAIISIGLCWYLIPIYGARGAAAAFATAMAVSCVHARIVGRFAYPLPLPLGAAGRIAIACAAMAVVVLAIPGTGPVAFIVQAVAGGVAYAVTALLLNVMGLRHRVTAMRRGDRRLLEGAVQ